MLCLVLLGAGMTAEAVRIAAIGDYGDGGPDTPRVADLVRSWEPDVIITEGDNCYAPGDHLSNVDPYYGDYVATDRLFPAIGNHDRDDCGGYDAYFAYFGVPGRYYALELGPVHVFFLNSEPDEPDGVTSDSPQAQWLQDALAASSAPWKIVSFHRPPYSSGVEHGSQGYMQWPFQAWGATHVLASDDHLFEALEVDGFPYFVNGLGGAIIHDFGLPIAGSLFRYNADHGAMLIEAEASFMTLTFYSVSEGPLYSVTFPAESPPDGGVLIPQQQMQVVSVDSQDVVGGNYAATNAIDGNPATIWHTEWFQQTAPLPHTLVLSLGGQYHVDGVRYLPRQDGNPNGTIASYEVYVSDDGVTWGSAVAAGTLAANTSEKTVRFTAKTGRFVRLVASSEINGQPWTSAAELNIFGAAAPSSTTAMKP
jgi:hypothetical protein